MILSIVERDFLRALKRSKHLENLTYCVLSGFYNLFKAYKTGDLFLSLLHRHKLPTFGKTPPVIENKAHYLSYDDNSVTALYRYPNHTEFHFGLFLRDDIVKSNPECDPSWGFSNQVKSKRIILPSNRLKLVHT